MLNILLLCFDPILNKLLTQKATHLSFIFVCWLQWTKRWFLHTKISSSIMYPLYPLLCTFSNICFTML